MMDGEKDSSRDGWMDDVGKLDFGITLCGTGMNTNGLMLHVPPLPSTETIPFLPSYSLKEVTHEFYRQLYPNIIRDIDVSS